MTRASDLRVRLLDCTLAYVAREGGVDALEALQERIAPLRSESWGEVGESHDRLSAVLRFVEEILGPGHNPERLGRALPELLRGDVFSTLVQDAGGISAVYTSLPGVFDVLDPRTSVSVERRGRRRLRVRFVDTGGVPPEIRAFRRGLLAALPTIRGLPPSTTRDALEETSRSVRSSPAGAKTYIVEVSWQGRGQRSDPWLGLVAGGVLGAATFFLPALYEPELLSMPLRVVGVVAVAALGGLLGLRRQLTAQIMRQNALVAEQNNMLLTKVSSLRRSHDSMWNARAALEDEVRARTSELQRERDHVRQLLSLGQDMNATLDLDALLGTVTARVPIMLGARSASVYLLDRERDQLNLVAHTYRDAAPEPEHIPISVTLDEGSALPGDVPGALMLRAIERDESLLVGDIEVEVGRPPRQRHETRSCVVVLLRSGGVVVGVLNIADSVYGERFERDQYDLAKIVGDHLGTALGNALLMRRTQLLSITDGLTGLYLHRHFQETLEREIQRSRRYARPLSLMIIDVDRFKRYNDNYGHPAGDAVLRQVAGALRQELRTSDIPARYGGDEFAVVLPQTEKEGAVRLAERVRRAVAKRPTRRGDEGPEVTLSIGVATYLPYMERADFVTAADEALYRAKAWGRNVVRVAGEDEFASKGIFDGHHTHAKKGA